MDDKSHYSAQNVPKIGRTERQRESESFIVCIYGFSFCIHINRLNIGLCASKNRFAIFVFLFVILLYIFFFFLLVIFFFFFDRFIDALSLSPVMYSTRVFNRNILVQCFAAAAAVFFALQPSACFRISADANICEYIEHLNFAKISGWKNWQATGTSSEHFH